MKIKDEYTTKFALWYCAHCLREHKNAHHLRLLILLKPDGTFMMDYIGTFNLDLSHEEHQIDNGYQNKIRYLQLVQLCVCRWRTLSGK